MLDALITEVTKTAAQNGWDEDPNPYTTLLHLYSELAECNKAMDAGDIAVRYHRGKPEGLGTELADVIILAIHLAGQMECDLSEALAAKLHYNRALPFRSRSTTATT